MRSFRRHLALLAVLVTLAPSTAHAASTWHFLTWSGPGGRWGPASAHLPGQGTVVFGGCANGWTNPCSVSHAAQDTWVATATGWTSLSPAAKPAVRLGAMMAYDSIDDRLILFGGMTGGSPGSFYSDTWAWDGTNWTQLFPTTTPTGRAWGGMATDSSGRVVLFGGCSAVNATNNCQTWRGDTWRWTGTNWTSACVGGVAGSCSPAPVPRQIPSMTKGTMSNGSVYLFGGDHYGIFRNDLWKWNGTTRAWSAVNVGLTQPSGRGGGVLAPVMYNGTEVLLLYGGGDSPTHLYNETWLHTAAGWIQCSTCNDPFYPVAVPAYSENPSRTEIFMYGGIRDDNRSPSHSEYRFA